MIGHRSLVYKTDNLRIHITGNVLALDRPLSSWSKFLTGNGVEGSAKVPRPVCYAKDLVTALGEKPSQSVFIVSMPAIESSYCVFMTKGPGSFQDPDIAALMVLNEYLSTMEGPFWKQVRGNGLAYGASLRLAIESGRTFEWCFAAHLLAFISFVIYRSPDGFKAFEKVKEIIAKLSSGEETLDETFLEAAKSSVIFSIIAREVSPSR